jgi:hypothetical protein
VEAEIVRSVAYTEFPARLPAELIAVAAARSFFENADRQGNRREEAC